MTERRFQPSNLLLVCALASLAGACKRDDQQRRAAAAKELPPLVASSATSSLAVNGFGDAVVALPVGATQEMPVVVAVLGIGDTPEEQCSTWRDLVGTRAFVLCPRGARNMVVEEPEGVDGAAATPAATASDEETEDSPKAEPTRDGGRTKQVGFYPVDLATLDREVTAGLAALKSRWGAHVSDREVVYAGFSRGAFLGASLAAKHPERFSRLVLIEGGQSPWQPQTTAAFARGGGKRVLFACGQAKCMEDAEVAATALRAQKVETKLALGDGEGHGYRKQVKEELKRSLDWVMEGQPGWQKGAAR
jgi:predicted esterase